MWNTAKTPYARLGLLAACVGLLIAAIAPHAAAQSTNGQIVFASYAIDTDNDGLVSSRDLSIIFIVNPDGTGLTQVTDGTTFDREPVWSPQGDRIVFTSRIDTNDDGVINEADTAGLEIINPDGADRLRLASDTLNVRQPTWAPQGDRLAFVSQRDTNEDQIINGADLSAIYIIDAMGGGLRPVTGDDMDATDPSFAADGRLAFSAVTDTTGDGVIDKDSGDTASIYIFDPSTGDTTQITEADSSDFNPQVSPDGTQVVYQSFRLDNTRDNIITPADIPSITIIGIDGSNRQQITDDQYIDLDPSWSPDGATIVFRSFRADSNGDTSITLQDNAGIYKVSARGGNLVPLSDPRGNADHPDWSPDGTRVVYHGQIDGNGDGQLDPPSLFISDATITNPDDLSVTAITGVNSIDFQASWSHPGGAVPAVAAAEPTVEPTVEPVEVQPTVEPVEIATVEPIATIAAAPTEEPPAPTETPAEPLATPTFIIMTPMPTVEMPTVAPVDAQPTEAASIIEVLATETPAAPPAEAQPTAEPPAAPAGPMRLTFYSRNADTTGDGFIDARDSHNIMVANADGSDLKQISGIDSDDKGPVWSPDHQQVAYVGRADATGDGAIRQDDLAGIFVIAADGGTPTRLTPADMYAFSPAWSPDSARLAFAAATEDTDGDDIVNDRDNSSIYIVNRDGSNLVQVTTENTSDFDPAWSPDGTKLAFASRVTDTSGDAKIGINDNASIVVVGADGSNLTQITINATEDQRPVWSPDGSRLVFSSWTTDSNLDGYISADQDYPGIFVIDANGANLGRLTVDGTYAHYPAWKPDGSRIVYVVREDTDQDGYMRFNDAGYLFVTDYAGNLTAQLTDDTFGTLRPSWSPDGTLIAYHSWRDLNGDGIIKFPDTPSIFTVTPDGATVTQITPDDSNDFDPSWTPGN